MKSFFPLFFITLFLGVIVGANIYLAFRFNWYFDIENTKILNVVFPLLTSFMIFGMIPLSNTLSRLGSFIYILAAVTMGVMLYLLLSVILVDLVHLFTKLPLKTYGISALAITFLISFLGVINSWNVQLTEREIAIKGITREIRLMHLSDIHLGHFRGKKFLQKIIDKTTRQNIDVVFLTGDLFDGRIQLSLETLAPLAQIKVPIFFIEGNHDRYTGVKTIKNLLREMKIHVLENELKHWNGLQIIGLNHMRADDVTYNIHAAGNHATIKSTLEKLPINKNEPTILLHHSPDGIQYANQYGTDLYLAGHTHAGQLFPIKYIANLIFDYNKGLHDFKGTKIFVSQGIGTFGPPMRVGTKSEIAVIKLKPKI